MFNFPWRHRRCIYCWCQCKSVSIRCLAICRCIPNGRRHIWIVWWHHFLKIDLFLSLRHGKYRRTLSIWRCRLFFLLAWWNRLFQISFRGFSWWAFYRTYQSSISWGRLFLPFIRNCTLWITFDWFCHWVASGTSTYMSLQHHLSR